MIQTQFGRIKFKWYSKNNHFKESDRIDGMHTEFEWKIFPRFTLIITEEIQKLMERFQCEPEHFNDRIIFMSMYNDISWWKNGNTEKCVSEVYWSCEVRSQVPLRSFVILGTWIRKEMIRDLFRWTRRKLGQSCRNDHTQIKYRIRSSNISCIQRHWKSAFRKQKTWQEVCPLQRKWRKHRAASPHGDFCKSAQYLRCRSRSVQRIEQISSRRFSWRVIRRLRKLGSTSYRRGTKWDETFFWE